MITERDPVLDPAVASRAGEGEIAIGGATPAAEAAVLCLIDEYRARADPVLVSVAFRSFPSASAG
jgi:hypothetical protein